MLNTDHLFTASITTDETFQVVLVARYGLEVCLHLISPIYQRHRLLSSVVPDETGLR